ncbi:hypothetical protein MMAN_30550 [Mycobacterium mantenii]|uniref:Uncharacterized protein n=1 Tax=Mycobacterium mantenii TaxID=560555 RepID=A0ABN6ABB3_MYCNT|nr:hypothetical protein MMAN_30550 [Mycobacterium mantenii]
MDWVGARARPSPWGLAPHDAALLASHPPDGDEKLSGPTRWVTRLAGLVVVTAAADGVSHPSHQHQYQTDDEEDDPEDQNNVGEGEGRDEAREQESEDDKDDSENDHNVCLVSV